MNCLRCHQTKDLATVGDIKVCNECIQLIIKEWDIKYQEVYEELQAA